MRARCRLVDAKVHAIRGDLMMLSKDIFSLTPREVLDTSAVLTMAGGGIVRHTSPER